MKDWLKSLTREQIAFAACAAVAAVLLLAGVAGGPGGPGDDAFPASRAREHRPWPGLQFRPVDADFEKYWGGRNVFLTESTTQLPVPAIAAPMPRIENPVVPLFRPAPPLRIYNEKAKAKYPAPGTRAVVAEADLPAADQLEALKKIEEPALTPFKDQSDDREREFCVVIFNSAQQPDEGKCVAGCARQEEAPDVLVLGLKGGAGSHTWKKSAIKEIQHSWKNSEQLAYRRKKLAGAPQEADRRVELARWCHEPEPLQPKADAEANRLCHGTPDECRQRGMIESATQDLRSALELKRDHARAILLLGEILEEQGDFDAALAHYELCVQAAPAMREELWLRVAEGLRKLGCFESALDAYGKSVLSPLSFRGKVGQARMSVELGDPARTVEIVTDMFGKYSNDQKNFTPELRTAALTARGRAHLSLGRFAEALPDLDAASKAKSAEAWNALGCCHAFEGRWKDASSAFAAALLQDQYAGEAWTNLAHLYLLAGKPAEAAALLAKAAERDPADADVPACQALAFLLGGNGEDAAKRLDAALTADPGHAYANYLRGELMLRSGNLDAALAGSREALRREPLFLPACSGVAVSCLRLAESQTAEAARLAALCEAADRSLPALGRLWGEAARDQIRLVPDAWRASARADLVRASTLFGRIEDQNRINVQLALACADLLLRRPEPARKRLDHAKQLVRDASLRADPIVEYAYGYLHYLFGSEDAAGRLAAARSYFKAASEVKDKDYEDPVSLRFVQEAAETVKKIDEWTATSYAVDETFSREDSDRIQGRGRNQWIEVDERPRVPIVLSGQRCLFAGEPGDDWVPSLLERDNLAIDKFSRLEATFYPEAQPSVSFEFGVSLYGPRVQENAPRPGLHFAFDRARRLRVSTWTSDRFLKDRHEITEGEWQTANQQYRAPQEIRLRLERRRKEHASQIEVQIYDPAKRDYAKVAEMPWPFTNLQGKGGLKVSFWARGERRIRFTLALDDVRIYERRK
ncbi:MAG: hypothetical protein HYY17_14965 [Planctomycetes bacterium]|nr:hypothetical protein [Planctomycetota bacterium]